MNERIQELAEQCRSYWKSAGGITYPQFDHRKFAELIIRECAGVVFKKVGPKSALDVLEHFGVKE